MGGNQPAHFPVVAEKVTVAVAISAFPMRSTCTFPLLFSLG